MTMIAVGSGDVVIVKDDSQEAPVYSFASLYTAKIDDVIADKATDRKVLASITPIAPTSSSGLHTALMLHFVEKGSLG